MRKRSRRWPDIFFGFVGRGLGVSRQRSPANRARTTRRGLPDRPVAVISIRRLLGFRVLLVLTR
jgi:hypothetical protein